MSSDLINHPPHYTQHPSGVECIEIAEHLPFCLGSALKYVWRAGQKEGAPRLDDLKKARWYLRQRNLMHSHWRSVRASIVQRTPDLHSHVRRVLEHEESGSLLGAFLRELTYGRRLASVARSPGCAMGDNKSFWDLLDAACASGGHP
jgi:hypothetical protein